MHRFTGLIDGSTNFTLRALKETEEKILIELRTSGATYLVRGLQMLSLQKAILAVGMFSVFEAILQDGLGCEKGFLEAKSILTKEDEGSIKEQFNDLILAINVLKHGRGKSYDKLVAKADQLPFRVKHSDDGYPEGDVSEISLLIDVDFDFITHCVQTIRDVSRVVERARPNYYA
jgi:hypothetical protein